ncbi:MAG: outer membrane beta-barrel protein [Bacteroidales bacterium]
MKRFWVFILFFGFILISGTIYGQRIQGAVIAGMNLSQVDGDEVYGYKKVGLNTGLGALLPIKKRFLLTMEILYNQKGAYERDQYIRFDQDTSGKIIEITGKYQLKLDYLEVPILFLYNDRDIITAGAGFSYGRLVSVKEYEHGQKVETTTLNGGLITEMIIITCQLYGFGFIKNKT